MSLNIPEFLWRCLCKYQHTNAVLSLINSSDYSVLPFENWTWRTYYTRDEISKVVQRERKKRKKKSEGTLRYIIKLNISQNPLFIPHWRSRKSAKFICGCWMKWPTGHEPEADAVHPHRSLWWSGRAGNNLIGTQWENSRIWLMIINCFELYIYRVYLTGVITIPSLRTTY